MAAKRTPKKKTGPAKKATKKRVSKAPPKKAAQRAPRSQGTAKPARPTRPAKPRAKKTAPVSAPVSAPVPPHAGEASRAASYLEGVPRDQAELAAGLLQVVRGAAKDLKTLVTQAIAMSNQKNDRFDR